MFMPARKHARLMVTDLTVVKDDTLKRILPVGAGKGLALVVET